MLKYFAKTGGKIRHRLAQHLKNQDKTSQDLSWTHDVVAKLIPFTTQGKMLRGGLVILGYEAAGQKANDRVYNVAGGLELIHSSLLIHDDIMDNDQRRRGIPTIHTQYAQLAQKQGLENSDHFGSSMALGAGIAGYFWGMEMIASALSNHIKGVEILRTISREIGNVALAQMSDVYHGYLRNTPSKEDILNIYRHKTARYSTSLPLIVGGKMANACNNLIHKFQEFGEDLGLIFQIKDDQMSIFGDEKAIGKPVGSDIRENKKTLLYYMLFQKITANERKQMQSIFGNPGISRDDVGLVQKLIVKYKILEELNEYISALASQAKDVVKDMLVHKKYQHIFYQLIDYNLTRNH
jgi:geranylgeranyl diphosphate synthase type I